MNIIELAGNYRQSKLIVILLFCMINELSAQNTLKYFENETNSPEANISDIDWLSGTWIYKTKQVEMHNICSYPSRANSLVFVLQRVEEEKLVKYIAGTISEEGSTLVLRIRTYNPDFVEDDMNLKVERKLVKKTSSRLYFDNYTFERKNSRKMTLFFLDNEEDISPDEVRYEFKLLEIN